MTDLDVKAIRSRCEVAKKTGEWAHWSKDYVPALCDEVERLRSELGVMIDLDVKPYSHSDPFLADVRRRYAPDVWGGADTIPRLLATIDAARARIAELEADTARLMAALTKLVIEIINCDQCDRCTHAAETARAALAPAPTEKP